MQVQQPLPTSSEFIDLRVYLTALRRRRTVIAVLAALGLGLGLGYSKLQTPLYTATAEVLINPPPGSSTLNLNNTISVGTEAQVVKSAPVADVAAKSLGSPPVSTQLLKHVSVKTSPSSFVMGISYSDPNSSQAAAGANAFANAYLEYRQQLGDDQIAQQQDSIGKQIAQLQSEQKLENKALEASTPGTIVYRNAQDALNQLSVRLAVLASSIAELPTFVNPGQIILPAVAPAQATST